MFGKIVVPLDLTDRHQPALDVAADLALRGGGTVTLIHVIETIAGLSREEESGFYTRLERAAHHHLDRWEADLRRRKVSFVDEIRFGHRAAETVRFAMDTGADLIILTAPPVDPSNPAAAWGSLSHQIGVLSPCPVLLVKPTMRSIVSVAT